MPKFSVVFFRNLKIDQSIIELIDLKQIYKNAISGGLVVLKKGEYFLTELGESFLEKFDV